jgi:CheY-like chemotaxis protein
LSIETGNLFVDDDYADMWPDVTLGHYVKLRVSDNGTGMTGDVLNRAFEPFFTTKPKGEGSGLGLATVYGIVAQAGGHVHLYSEEGLGTTVVALLPASEDDEVVVEPARRQTVAGGETVLVVEDEDLLREATTRILQRNGYRVISAANGHDALEAAREHQGEIHLLLTDVVMPKMLGREVADHVRAARPGIQVVYMSGYAGPVLGASGNLDPDVRLVEKPFSESMLLGCLREVLDAPE